LRPSSERRGLHIRALPPNASVGNRKRLDWTDRNRFREAIHVFGRSIPDGSTPKRSSLPNTMLPVLLIRRRRLQSPREHHRLGAERILHALQRSEDRQMGHLPLRLWSAAFAG